jgi:hypothetical protein
MNKLYLVHCGYYDSEISDGVFEFHVNHWVVAQDFESARAAAKLLPEFKAKRMHVDGLQEIQAVQGFRIQLEEDLSLQGASQVSSSRHRDLAPKSPSP